MGLFLASPEKKKRINHQQQENRETERQRATKATNTEQPSEMNMKNERKTKNKSSEKPKINARKVELVIVESINVERTMRTDE